MKAIFLCVFIIVAVALTTVYLSFMDRIIGELGLWAFFLLPVMLLAPLVVAFLAFGSAESLVGPLDQDERRGVSEPSSSLETVKRGVARTEHSHNNDPDFSDALDYVFGWNGKESDIQKSAELFERSARNGNPIAMSHLGYLYSGELTGDDDMLDPKKAFDWYLKSAMAGGQDLATFNLGICYEQGKGVEKDHQKALYWMEKAAESGYDAAKKWLDNNQA